MKEYLGSVSEVAADVDGMALYVDLKAGDGTATYLGWIGIDPQIAQEGLAVGLAALRSSGQVSIRMDETLRIAQAVRAIV